MGGRSAPAVVAQLPGIGRSAGAVSAPCHGRMAPVVAQLPGIFVQAGAAGRLTVTARRRLYVCAACSDRCMLRLLWSPAAGHPGPTAGLTHGTAAGTRRPPYHRAVWYATVCHRTVLHLTLAYSGFPCGSMGRRAPESCSICSVNVAVSRGWPFVPLRAGISPDQV